MDKKNPMGMSMAAAGTPMRATHIHGVGRTAASASNWQTRDKITKTPA